MHFTMVLTLWKWLVYFLSYEGSKLSIYAVKKFSLNCKVWTTVSKKLAILAVSIKNIKKNFTWRVKQYEIYWQKLQGKFSNRSTKT